MSDLIPSQGPSALSNNREAAADRPPLLPSTTAEEFLPAPGRNAAQLVRAVLALAIVGSASMLIWPLQETVRAAGVVRPSGENTTLQSEFSGRLTSIAVQMNQTVKKGQLLAVIEPSGMREERRQLQQELAALERQERQARLQQQSIENQLRSINLLSRALVETSRRTVDQARATRAFDRSELNRYTQLQATGAVPRSLVDEKRARQMVSESEVMKALQGVNEQRARGLTEQAQLAQSASQARSNADELLKQVAARRARLQVVERALQQSMLRAPLEASVISSSLHHPGQLIQAGETVLILAPQQSRLDVRLLVPTRDISQIHPGQEASLRIAACPTPEFGVMPARVASLSQDTLPTPQGRNGSGQAGAADGGQASPVAYEVRLQPLRTMLRSRQGGCRLRLGMEVIGDVITRRTTVFAYLLNKLKLSTF
jgi:multidrug resistance efflux pump